MIVKKDFANRNNIIIEVGDKIHAQGCTFEVAKIFSQFYYGEEDGVYIEFEDPKGNYHYWKQGCDGGYIIDKNKRYIAIESMG